MRYYAVTQSHEKPYVIAEFADRALRVIALVPFIGGLAWLAGTVLGLGTLWVAACTAQSESRPFATPLVPPPPVTR